jgi:ABC-type antimicrobial peptide transport system permease subunit
LALLQDITRVVRAADPSLPLEGAKSLDRVIETTLAPRAARFGVVGVFAAGAILLAFVGLSGALIRSVVEQQRELAIRAAIGATPRVLLASVLRQGAVLALAGVVAGLVASAALARAVATLFFGVTPHDPLTYAGTAVAVLLVAIGACYVPARRAAAADPILLLRAE